MSQKLSLKHQIIEAYSRIDERARITGVALIPRISRNNNLYTKEELKRFNNVQVPLNWEHDPSKQIGSVTFHYNPDLETVYYDGMITDDSAADLARNKTLFTSIEADPVEMKEICNGPNDCFSMPFGLVPVGLALTETPGVPETSVTVIEKYLKECEMDEELEQKYSKYLNTNVDKQDFMIHKAEQGRGEPNDDCISRKIGIIKDEHPDMSQDQAVAIAVSHCSGEAMDLFKKHGFFEHLELECCDCGEIKKKNKLPSLVQQTGQ